MGQNQSFFPEFVSVRHHGHKNTKVANILYSPGIPLPVTYLREIKVLSHKKLAENTPTNKNKRVSKVAQQEKALVPKPDYLSLSPGTHIVEEEN